jgi:hypothetical protein
VAAVTRIAAAGVLLVLGAASLWAGCGNRTAPDLFVLTRTGAIPGAGLTLRVSDSGLVRCNGRAGRRMPDPLLLDAREIARELEGPAEDGRTLPPGPRSVLRYRLRLEGGTVRFSDSSHGQTREMFLAQAFARRVAQQVCGLAR